MKIRVTYPESFTTKRPDGKSRVYDCFSFYNEMDLLEIRLNVLKDAVDYHVIAESPLTFRGQDKELFFENNKARYAEFADKIIHVVVEDYENPGKYHPKKVAKDNDVWIREGGQRNGTMRGLERADPMDWVLVQDMDEIPRPEMVQRIAEDRMYRRGIYMFEMTFYQNRLNWQATKVPWLHGTRMIEKRFLTTPHAMRIHKYHAHKNSILPWLDWRARTMWDLKAFVFPHRIPAGGWHFSSMGDADFVVNKHWSYAHYDEQKEDVMNTGNIGDRLASGLNQWGRKPIVAPLSHLPDYLQQNAGRYPHLFELDPADPGNAVLHRGTPAA